MKTSKLSLENHPTLFDLTPYTISIVEKVKRSARKAMTAVKEAVEKTVEKVTQKKAEHPTLFKLSGYTLTLAELKEIAQKKIDVALLSIASAKTSREMTAFKVPAVVKKPAPYNHEGVRALAEAMLTEALYSLKTISKKAVPSRLEIEELKEFFSGIGQMLTIAGIGSGDSTQKLAARILEDAEDRLLQAAA